MTYGMKERAATERFSVLNRVRLRFDTQMESVVEKQERHGWLQQNHPNPSVGKWQDCQFHSPIKLPRHRRTMIDDNRSIRSTLRPSSQPLTREKKERKKERCWSKRQNQKQTKIAKKEEWVSERSENLLFFFFFGEVEKSVDERRRFSRNQRRSVTIRLKKP